MPLRDALHDQIDHQEEIREKALQAVDVLRERLTEAVAETGDFMEALELVALELEDALDDLTTEAVKKAAALGARRTEMVDG